MSKSKLLIALLAATLIPFGKPLAQSQTDFSNSLAGIITVNIDDIFINPMSLKNCWATKPVSLTNYSQAAIDVQRRWNEQAEYVVTSNSGDSEWTEIDQEEITPYTWKWIDIEMEDQILGQTMISLRRPNWWIIGVGGTEVGNWIQVKLPEMGIDGKGKVTGIRPSLLDTRLLYDNDPRQPITGKFSKSTEEIYNLYVQGSDKALGVTPNHPIWSVNRNAWVQAGELEVGERLGTSTGDVELVKREKSVGNFTVYNLEVFRDHNYFVSSRSILAHNTCFEELRTVISKQILDENALVSKLTERFKVRWAGGLTSEGRYNVLATTFQATGEPSKTGILGVLKKFKEIAASNNARSIHIKAEGLSTEFIQSFFKRFDGKEIYGMKVSYTEKMYGSKAVGSADLVGDL